MGLLQALKKIFGQKNPPQVGIWYMVDYSEAAKEFSVGNDFCKKIFQMHDKSLTEISHPYTEAKVKMLEKNSQIVIDMTEGLEVPRESTFVPRTETAFGTIQLTKRVY